MIKNNMFKPELAGKYNYSGLYCVASNKYKIRFVYIDNSMFIQFLPRT